MVIVPMPVTGEYYIDGHVNRTGVYSLTARNITLKQAIAAAGGLDQLAIPSTHTEIIRRIGQDKEVFASVDLDKVFSGQQPDIYLKPNDIVRVGTNAFAPFVAAFRNGYRITYGFGFLYDRNWAPQQKFQ
jgi:protein involved in polysaccharide export with SLBB domain